jgi:hypothetical protein
VRPDAALLNVNVAGERSFDIVDHLAAQHVPFVLGTDFDAATVLPERFRGTVVVNKPFAASEIEAALRPACKVAVAELGGPDVLRSVLSPFSPRTLASRTSRLI